MMTRISLFVCFIFSSTSWAETSYIVRPGDTVLKISDRLIESGKSSLNRYQMARKIRSMNPQIKDFNALSPGDSLKLPEEIKASAKPAPAVKAPVEIAPQVVEATPLAEPEATVPAITPMPTQGSVEAEVQIEAVEHDAESHPNFLLIQPRFQRQEYKIKLESTHEDFKSDANVMGLGLGFGWALGEKIHLLVLAGANQAKLGKFSQAELQKTSQLLKNFGLGLEYHLLHPLKIELLALYNDHLFILPDGSGNFEVKNLAIPGAELVFDWSIFQLQTSTFGLTAGAEYAARASKFGQKFKASVEPLGSLYWQTNRAGRTNYRVSATYTMSGQSPEDEVEQEVSVVGLNLGIVFPL